MLFHQKSHYSLSPFTPSLEPIVVYLKSPHQLIQDIRLPNHPIGRFYYRVFPMTPLAERIKVLPITPSSEPITVYFLSLHYHIHQIRFFFQPISWASSSLFSVTLSSETRNQIILSPYQKILLQFISHHPIRRSDKEWHPVTPVSELIQFISPHCIIRADK